MEKEAKNATKKKERKKRNGRRTRVGGWFFHFLFSVFPIFDSFFFTVNILFFLFLRFKKRRGWFKKPPVLVCSSNERCGGQKKTKKKLGKMTRKKLGNALWRPALPSDETEFCDFAKENSVKPLLMAANQLFVFFYIPSEKLGKNPVKPPQTGRVMRKPSGNGWKFLGNGKLDTSSTNEHVVARETR